MRRRQLGEKRAIESLGQDDKGRRVGSGSVRGNTACEKLSKRELLLLLVGDRGSTFTCVGHTRKQRGMYHVDDRPLYLLILRADALIVVVWRVKQF